MPVQDDILYGRQPVLEAIRAGRRRLHEIWVKRTAKSAPDLDEAVGLAARAGLAIRRVEDQALDSLTHQGHHQGLAAKAGPYPYVTIEDLTAGLEGLKPPALILLLDHIQDPQNLGAVLRTAEAAGVNGVLIPADRAADVTAAAVRASAGAAEHVRVARVTNLVRSMGILKDCGLWIAGLEATPEAKPCAEADLKGPLGLVVGSEGEGLGRLVRENCDFLVRLPMLGRVNSLNASAACAIALYEILRQRGAR